MQYGAPLIIASTFLLLMGVSLLRPKSSFLAFGGKPAIAVPAPRGLSSIPVPSPGTFGGAYQPIPVPRPVAFTQPQQIPVPAAAIVTPEVAREAALLANQRQLNQMAASVNSTLLADEAARLQSLRSASAPRTGAFQRAAMQSASSVSSQTAF